MLLLSMVGGETVNRRTMGRVKQARKRAQRKADIRAGRRMSMQEYVNGSHNHNHPEGYGVDADGNLLPRSQELVETMTEEPALPEGTHELVRLYGDGATLIARGTEYKMRKLRTELMYQEPNADYTYQVRKVK